MNFFSLFAGIGGFDLGLERAGMTCIGQCEIDPFCNKVLAKHWPSIWRHGDIKTLTGEMIRENCGQPDLLCGGFPCQDLSIAGNQAGIIEGNRSGLWFEFIRLIREVGPRFVIVENVAALLDGGIGIVLSGLAEGGYDAEWSMLSACAFSAPHTRERVFIIAYSNKIRRRFGRNRMSDAPRSDHWKATQDKCGWQDVECWLRETFQGSYGTATASELKRVDEWFPERLDRCDSLGNAVVPQVAEFVGRRIIEATEI